jgi:NitT/TauT family transport system substrate-binding protein
MALKPAGKAIIFALVIGGLAGGYLKFKDQILPKGKEAGSVAGMMSGGTTALSEGQCIKVGVNTWGGFVGLQYMNGGAKPSADSRLQKEFGVCAEFIVLDDINPSRETWKAGKVDLLWGTIDAFPTEVAGLEAQKPIALLQVDWSRGGDAIVVRKGINSAADLKGKTIAVADMSPSMTFLLWMLDAAGLSLSDVQLSLVGSGIDAAAQFKAGKVDAAVVWSPDDQDCITNQKGSKVLTNTKQATNIIADVMYVKKEFLDNNRDKLTKLVQAWMVGNAEMNTNAASRAAAAKIMAGIYNQPEDFCNIAVNNVRFANYGDNMDFFGSSVGFLGIKGEDLYNKMAGVYKTLGKADGKIPNWRVITDVSFMEGVNMSGKPGQESEHAATFVAPTQEQKVAPAIASKPVTINFASGSSVLDENAKYIVDDKLVDLAKAFPTCRIRLEGNTDAVGSHATNVYLSRSRAQALASYLIKEHGFDSNRFVVVGNGPDKPLCSDASPECNSKNRRTEFQILE